MLEDFLNNTAVLNYGVKILGSICILIIAYILMKICVKIMNIAFVKAKVDITLSSFLIKLFKVIFIILSILAALNNLGINTTSFVALFTASSLAISFAFQQSFSNIAAGVLIIIFRPFKVGDEIAIASVNGVVLEISLYCVILRTVDNVNVIMPNSKIINENITNYSREKIRRIQIRKSIAHSQLTDKRSQIDAIMQANKQILKDKNYQVNVASFNDSSLDIDIICWVKNEEYLQAFALLQEELSEVFK